MSETQSEYYSGKDACNGLWEIHLEEECEIVEVKASKPWMSLFYTPSQARELAAALMAAADYVEANQ